MKLNIANTNMHIATTTVSFIKFLGEMLWRAASELVADWVQQLVLLDCSVLTTDQGWEGES